MADEKVPELRSMNEWQRGTCPTLLGGRGIHPVRTATILPQGA
jgi:hypothetical protein